MKKSTTLREMKPTAGFRRGKIGSKAKIYSTTLRNMKPPTGLTKLWRILTEHKKEFIEQSMATFKELTKLNQSITLNFFSPFSDYIAV